MEEEEKREMKPARRATAGARLEFDTVQRFDAFRHFCGVSLTHGG